MTTCVIDLNDDELRVASNAEVVAQAVGHAALVEGSLELGERALRAAQRQPRSSENRHWRDLSLAPIEHLGPRARHYADLAWLQLEYLRRQAGNPSEAVLCVPGSFSTEQLSLLLGIAQSGGLRVTALVDSAVAAGASALPAGEWLHLDLQQHQAVLTRLAVDTQVRRETVEVLPGLGTGRLRTLCLEVVANAFVREARFDPLHHADSEGVLLERLAGWLDALRQSAELQVAVDHDGRRFQARLHRARLVEAASPVLRELQAALPAGVAAVASHRLARQPGFTELFPTTPVLGPRAVFLGCKALALQTASSGGALPLQTLVPAAATPTVKVATQAPAATTATHLLCGTEAFPVVARALQLLPDGGVAAGLAPTSAAQAQATAAGLQLTPAEPGRVLVNGSPIATACVLAPGDRVSFVHGNGFFIAIRVHTGDAA